MNELEKLELDDLYFGSLTEGVKEQEKFKIENLNSANWAFRKLSAIENKRKEIEELANKEIERIQEWREQETKGLDSSKEFFEGLLIEYFSIQREVDPKFKISTPYGKISARKLPDKWEYDDKELLAYLEAAKPDLIRIKKEVDKANLKKKVAESKEFAICDNQVVNMESGEVVSGVTVTEQPEKITIKVAE
jgi:hypothetical protein